MKKILVIEDDEPLCWLLERILNEKYEVHVVSNGLKALSWLSKGNVPDLIISDLNMPALDGKQLLKMVKNSGFYRNIPVIILSCHLDDHTRIQCLELGADDYFVKPFNPEVIKNRVKDLFFNQIIARV
jgi:two-component system, chemotaxis family, chemotaxis protein CheY